MTGKWKPKPKKVVETSLGKAPKEREPLPDISHLKKPIETSVTNFKHIINLFQAATPEVQDYITYECDLLYECRICRNIFRSLANFVLHKRNFCRAKHQFGGGRTDNEKGGFIINDDIKTSDEESRCVTPVDEENNKSGKNLLPIIDKLIQKQKIQILSKDIVNEDLSKTENDDDDVIFVSEENNLLLEKIENSKAAVFQTTVQDLRNLQKETMKSEVMEIHGILDTNEVVLGSNGKIRSYSSSKPNSTKTTRKLTCSECNFTVSTEKTLTHHLKYKHNKTCMVFPCPDCKETFSNAWNVYRHLYKIHRRTTSQVRRMRYLIHSSRIRKDQEPEKKKRKLNPEEENEENQWMNNFESDKDLQMCGGCGKRFERKAALHSHSQMCTKRIAVCNSIKNVKVLKNEKKEKAEVSNVDVKLKGAAKRKNSQPVVVQPIREVDLKESEVTASVQATPEDTDEVKLSSDPLETDITITKEDETDSSFENKPELAEVEIFTISDDSNDSKKCQTVNVADDLKEFIHDEEDVNFLAQMSNYIDKNKLMCLSCDMTFLSLYMLLRHMSSHFSWYRYQCSKCNYMSFHKLDCTTHAYSHHSTPSTLIDSTVLPIPKWKVVCTSHVFKKEEDEFASKMPRLEAAEETEDTIVLEDDEMPDITENGGDTVVLSDEEKKNEKKDLAGPSLNAGRPIRNRIKSVKTVQNDFIYDMTKVLKLDSNAKNKKVKKNLSK